jgi:hypothetical protein
MMEERDVAHPLATVAGLLVMALAFALLSLSAQPPSPRPVSMPADEFSAARALTLLERLIADGAPHTIGSAANAQVGARIADELTMLGYPVETQTTVSCRTAWAVCGEVTNIISRLPGQTAGPAVLLTAHYDSVAAGPGAADDMAGVATILEIARILREEPPQRSPVFFLLSDGEEPGLLGAEAFVASHPWAAEVGVVVNLEANGTHGQSILFETSENNAWLIDAFAARASRPVTSSVYDEIYALLPFDTDLSVYEEAGIAGVNFAFIEEHPQYHTPLDSPANVDPGSVQHQGDNALAAVRAYAALDLTNPPAGRLVFQDVAPGVVLRWPEPWTIWLALAVLIFWLALSIVSLRRGALRVRQLLWALPVLPLSVFASTVLGFALGLGVSSLAGAPAPWYAHPEPMRLAIAAGALLCLGLAAIAVARRAGFRGLYFGVWLGWSLLSVAVAAVLPTISPLVLLPTTLAALATAVMTIAPVHRVMRAWEATALVALFAASWFWLGLARGSDYSALSPDLGPTVGFAVGMSASAFAPFLALPVEFVRWRRWSLLGSIVLAVAAAIIALRVPVYSSTRPERLNLLHVQDRQSGQANWVLDGPTLADGSPAAVPEALLRAGPFDAQAMPVLPWSSRVYLTGPAPAADLPAADLSVRDTASAEGGREVRIDLPSSAGGNLWLLYVPQDAELRGIELEGSPHDTMTAPVEDGFHRFLCIAPACDGRTVLLHLDSAAPVVAYLVESAPGPPVDGENLIAARGDLAAPSGGGDQGLIVDRIEIAAP